MVKKLKAKPIARQTPTISAMVAQKQKSKLRSALTPKPALDPIIRVSKAEIQNATDRFVELQSVMRLIRDKTGIDLQHYDVFLPHLVQMRNKELFPYLHENTHVSADGRVYLGFASAVKVVEMLTKIVPEINIEISLPDRESIVKLLVANLLWAKPQSLTKCGEDSDQKILIRKDDFRMYKFETRYKTLDKHFTQQVQNEGLYLDPLDAEMLIKRHEAATQSSFTQSPKWLNLCWDAFRIVDNHSKAHIFQAVAPSHLQQRKHQVQPVDRIRETLQQRLYRSMHEFEQDMTAMFDEWLQKNRPTKHDSGHKYYRTALAIQDRFQKSMERAHVKVKEFDIKAELKRQQKTIA